MSLSVIERAVSILKQGGVVAFPTDTVYGLAADALNDSAVARLFEIKKRPADKAVPVMIGEIKDIYELVLEFPQNARRICEKYWPGALTIVLRKSEAISDLVSGGTDTVGIRIPDHELTLGIINKLGRPLAVTSANMSGEEALTDFIQVAERFGQDLDLILTGTVIHGKISTVADFTVVPPRILREGVFNLADDLSL